MGKWFFGERLLSTPGTDSLIQIHERNRLPSIRGKRNQNEAADGPSLETRPAVNQTTKFLVSASTRPARLSTSWKVLSEILSPSLSLSLAFLMRKGVIMRPGPRAAWTTGLLLSHKYLSLPHLVSSSVLVSRQPCRVDRNREKNERVSSPFLALSKDNEAAKSLERDPFLHVSPPIFPIFRYSKDSRGGETTTTAFAPANFSISKPTGFLSPRLDFSSFFSS